MSESGLAQLRRRVRTFLQKDIWDRDLADLPQPQRFLFRQVRVGLLVGRGFVKDRCALRAAGLTYITLLSLIPFLAAVFSIFQAFGPGLEGIAEEQLKPWIYKQLAAGAPTAEPGETRPPPDGEAAPEGGEISPDDDPPTPGDGGAPPDPEEVAPEGPDSGPPPATEGEATSGTDPPATDGPPPELVGTTVDEQHQAISQKIDELLVRVRGQKLGWLAILFMILTAVGLLTNIERSFNDIWGVRRHRSWIRRITLYWTGITLGSLCLGGSLAIAASFQSSSFVAWAEANLLVPQKTFQLLIPFLMTCVAFCILYLTIPNTRVSLLAGVMGGVVAAAMWETAKWGFTLYTAMTPRFDNLYGPLSFFIVFLLWVYLTWVIVLFGCELTFALQHAATYRQEEPSLQASPRYREVLILGLLSRIGRDFQSEAPPPNAQRLAEALQVPVRLVQELLFQLHEFGILVEAAGTEKSPGYVPARPLDRIAVQEVVDIVRHHSPADLDLPAGDETTEVTDLVDVSAVLSAWSSSEVTS